MHEREMEIQSGEITLSGTLSTPKNEGPHPLVICFHGSGPLDRNENTTHQKLNVFNALAEYLAVLDIACFRYDKRGIGKSGGHYKSAGHSDLVADALAVSQHFAVNAEFPQIFLLGHSEGTLIAPQVAQSCKVDGLLLLCPFITPLEELLEAQGREMQKYIDNAKGIIGWISRLYLRMIGGVTAINRKLIKRVRSSQKPVFWHMFRRVEARWIREMLEIDPNEVFSRVTTPTLLLVAGEDAQCPPEDGERIARVIGEQASHVRVPKLSHMLRIEGEAKGFAGYGEQIKQPLASEVKEEVGAWLETQIKKQANS